MPVNLKGRSFLTLKDFTPDEIRYMLNLAADLKAKKRAGIRGNLLAGKNIVLLFEKTSTRTRCAFEVAAYDEGANVTFLDSKSSQMGKKETMVDTAKVLGRFYDGIEYRGYDQKVVEGLAANAGVPVWNGLTDVDHPTQALADILTLMENTKKPLSKCKLVFCGDTRNNVAYCLMYICAKLGIHYVGWGPKELAPAADVVEYCREVGKETGAIVEYGENKELLKADIILVSDTSMISMQTPSITCGLRGLAYMEVEVTGPDKDLHSGLFGGAVANPANVLTRLVAQLVDKDGRVTIPGFYDDVRELTPAERKAFNKAPFSLAGYKKSLSIGDVEGEAGYTTLERTGVRPSLDVNGIWGGYTEEGTKTVIPSKASAKISMRLVPNQDYRKISRLFERYFRSIAPKSVKVKVKSLHGGMPYVAPTDMPAYKAAQKAIAETFGKKPLPFYSGGSIPIISGFESILGIKSLLMGFGLAEDAIHSPNESYGLEQFDRGVETIPLFYRYFAAEK